MTTLGASGLDFVSNEPVQGELLSHRLASGPLTPETALEIAIGIGNALAIAHAAGKVHGSLYPDKIALNGPSVQILQPKPADLQQFLPYRSPEQVRREQPDWRSDIFSFGAILYELATGRRAFSGSGTDLNEAIVTHPPAALMAKSPIYAAMEGVIAGCLQKDPARRRQRVQNAVIELKLASRNRPRPVAIKKSLASPAVQPLPAAATKLPPELAAGFSASGKTPAAAGRSEYWVAEQSSRGSGLRRRITVIALAVLALAASGVAAALYLHKQTVPVLKFSVSAPEHTSYPGTPAVSPDGLFLAFSAVGPEGNRMLWLRAFDEMHAKVIPGTEGGFAPFWSPDSHYIAFFAHKSLMKIRISAGSGDVKPEVLTYTETEPGGGSWNKDGTIVFSPSLTSGLFRVPSTGGKPSPVLKLDATRFELGDLWPQFLPDGKHFVYFTQTALPEATTGVYVASLDEAEKPRQLFVTATNAVFSPLAGESSSKGYLLYMKNRDLMGQGFNSSKLELTGDPIVLANDIGSIETLSLAPISVSSNAVLVYQSVGKPTRQLVWMDRAGQKQSTLGDAAEWGPPRIAPDGSRVAAGKPGKDGKPEIWIFSKEGQATAFETGSGNSVGSPVWSPDGSKIAYWGSHAGGAYDLFVKPVTGGKEEMIFKSPNSKYPTDWARDGRSLIFGEFTPNSKSDIWTLNLSDNRGSPILDTVRSEGYATLSPDGKWLAYQSDSDGRRNEVYVQPWDGGSYGTKRVWKVSNTGGGLPRWRADGGELFFLSATGGVMSASTHPTADNFQFDPPHLLFQTRPVPKFWNLFDVSPDGQRFVINLPLEWSNSSLITVMTNWTRKLEN